MVFFYLALSIAMITERLEERAALYVSGAMPARERADFELILEFHEELRKFTDALAEVGAAVTLASLPTHAPAPSEGVKARILAAVHARPQQVPTDGFVACDPRGLVQWVNPAFTALCGHTLDELRGKKLGPILQGEKTDVEAAERMRRAVHEYRPCRETILNYHKDGSAYWVDIHITPILDDAGTPVWLVAREREITNRPLP